MEGADFNPEEQLRISRSRIDQLRRENARLIEKFKVVMKMNTHWQCSATTLRERSTFSR